MNEVSAKGRAGTLGAFVDGRDNNFNLLRFMAASAVLASHSFALSTGSSSSEPLRQALGTTPGIIAVDVFFLTSGFLVTGSLVRRRAVKSFAMARALRIYPALSIAVSLTVLTVGLWFTSLSSSSFFTNPQTWAYWARNVTLITNVAHQLPGAFESTPWRFAVNASLWTLPYELTMYLLLALVWLAVSKVCKEPGHVFGRTLVAIAAVAMVAHLLLIGIVSSSALRLTAMFFTGSALFSLRSRLRLNGRVFSVLLLALLASAFREEVFSHLYPLALPYLAFYLAYVPRGLVRGFNRIGDYSYGIYIYAWPVQQMTASLCAGIDPLNMFGRSFLATSLLAIVSWHWIEKPSLERKPA